MKTLTVLLIRSYQKLSFILQPISQTVLGTSNQCIFEPTCSEYMIEAIRRFGVIRGVHRGSKRILRCRPGSPGGYDPVPKR